MTDQRDIVYTAIPKFLVYANLTIGAYVENHGYAANTPWQYSYGMGDKVDYEDLKESLHELLFASDEVWVFAEQEGTFPRHEDEVFGDLAVTDGVNREIRLAVKNDIPVKFYYFDAESRDIVPYGRMKAGPAEEWDGPLDENSFYLGTFEGNAMILHQFEQTDITDILDDFLVMRTKDTPGMSGGQVTLHNFSDPCTHGQRLEDPRTLKLGKEVPPRPELKKFCSVCDWPYPEEQLYEAMMRTPADYRGEA